MDQSEILKTIDGLTVQLANKALEYSDCSRRDGSLEIKKKVRVELKAIEKQINELKAELILLVATTPTN